MNRYEVKERSVFRSLSVIAGVVALVMGIIVLAWPSKSFSIVAAIIAIYAIIAGAVYVGMGFASQNKTGWGKAGNVILGILYIIAGIIMFSNLQAASAVVSTVIGLTIGFVWIFEGVIALTNVGQSTSKGWTVFYGIVSIIAGVFLVFTPFMAGFALWVLLGIVLIVLGVTQIIRWFR